jgi:hypothetical protein
MLITKGSLLTALGSDGDKFTAFMLDPASFGVTEPDITRLKIAKQKLDWTSNIETTLPEIVDLISLMLSHQIFTQSNIDAINAIDGQDNYIINVIAQDNITVENIYGAVLEGSSWKVKVDFVNTTLNKTHQELFIFDTLPEEQLQEAISSYIKMLKER